MTLPPYGWLDRNRLEQEALSRAQRLRADAAELSSLRRSDLELLGDRYWPQRHLTLLEPHDPGPDVAFLTVANDRFCRGLEALLLSLRAVYPQLASHFVVAHDGSIGPFLQRRLRQIHAPVEFVVPETPWADQLPRDSANRERVGLLGYLNGHALALRGHRRVVVLDADLLITGALDPLWAPGERFRAVPDCGDRPWAAVTPATRRPVVNSGVISIPGQALNDTLEQRFAALIREASQPVCPLLDRFADQKVWNLLLADQPLELLPLNFNCNVKYLVRFLEGCHENLSVVHFAGPKPWLTWPWVAPQAQDHRPLVVADHLLWNRQYRQLLMTWRLQLHREALSAAPPLPTGPAQLLLAPDALQAVPAGVSRHLVLADPAPFEGHWPDAPAWSAGWYERLQAAVPVQIWAPFEWEPAVRDLPLPAGAIWRWVLIEAPFSADLRQGEDLLADSGPWAGGFEPWSDPAWIGVARAARRQLEAAGAGPVESLHR
ncbi:hypothetical protein [Cyanobium sp. CH-040]|uniref:hypothetical protein n=1 Tax=Cyanobium sp. CH-040 TaxID=2823708 RepID=UPI0020CD3429|nr:hypothetical protein [Cyanobium sp. CH-040]MCP9928000.1 hypothetical protein [Cyanobium sp. CH-040]